MSKRRSRRVEQVIESHSLRRSPRLSQRHRSLLSTGERVTSFPLAYTATSRQSLNTYTRTREFDEHSIDSTSSSILNESGQSVPMSFEQGIEQTAAVSSESTQHEHTTAELGLSQQPHTPAQFPGDMPQHLYGLDGSDDESAYDDAAASTPSTRSYHVYNVERTIAKTPPRGDVVLAQSGFFSSVVSFFLNLLYKLGSLLYLTATAILCLDVLILNRCFSIFQAATGGTDMRPSKLWHRFWILLLALIGILVLLLGSGLVPEGHLLTVPAPGTHPVNITEEQWEHFSKQIEKSLFANLEEKLIAFKSTFRQEIEVELEKHIEKVVGIGLEAEAASRQAAINQFREAIMKEVNSSIEAHLQSLQSSVDARLSSLQASVLGQAESSITETVVSEMVKTHVQKETKQQISDAKHQWLSEAESSLLVEIQQSTNTLKQELILLLQQQQQQTLAQEGSTWRDANAAITKKLSDIEGQLQATASDLASMRTQHEGELSSLHKQQEDLLASFSQFKQSYLDDLHTLEQTSGKINISMATNLFTRELEKALADDKSALRLFISQSFSNLTVMQQQLIKIQNLINSGKVGTGGGITAEEVEQMIRAALNRYSADRIAKFDFALENSGGSVVVEKSSPTYYRALADVRLFGLKLWTVSTSCPNMIIQPQVYPGDCWAFEGSSGHALIRLRDEVVITGVTIEHVPSVLSPNSSLSSAPKDFSVWGKTSMDEEEKGDQLGQFTYSLEGPTIQEFIITEKSSKAYQYVLFKFLSNHGSIDFTCVYRVRVHGHYLN